MGRHRTDPPELRRLAIMRAADTSGRVKHGIGGLPKSAGRSQKPVTLPKLPWDDKPEDRDD